MAIVAVVACVAALVANNNAKTLAGVASKREGEANRQRKLAEDAARVRHLEHDVPLTAAEEDRARRKKAYEEQAKVRAIYEELVLKKPQPTVVQIGSLTDIKQATPANFANANKPVTIAPAPQQEAEPVAGD